MQTKAAVLATFLLLAGCNADSPTAPATVPASKHIEAEAEQCPLPLLGIVGTWVGGSYREYGYGENRESINTADTLRIEFAPDPNPAGEPGVTYYDYTLLSYYLPSDWDDFDWPNFLEEQRGKMGVYYADGGTWAFNHTVTYTRSWNEETKEYEEWQRKEYEEWQLWWQPKEYEEWMLWWEPSWGLEIKMFDGWLVLGDGWDDCYLCDYTSYRRVDE